MEADSHTLLRFVHVLLFAWWLGADLGVFLGGGRMSRPGMTVAERNRVRDLVMDIDLGPRLALVLMLPVGFGLSLRWGAPLPAVALPVLWGAALVWLGILVWLHLAHGHPRLGLMLRADLVVRSLVMVAMAGLGLQVLTAAPGSPVADTPPWLAAKFLGFAAIIAVGMVLRVLSGQWRPAIARIEAGQVALGEEMLRIRRRKAMVAALTMWTLVAGAAFLGVVKPG